MAGSSFIKDPDARLDYHIDWSAWLAGDTLLTSTWAILQGAGMTLDAASLTTTVTSIWATGGTAPGPVLVRNRITTVEGRTEDRTLILYILER